MTRTITCCVLAAVLLGDLACDAKSPVAPSPPLPTAVIGACVYTLDPSGLPATIPSTGGTFSVTLTTHVGCAWVVEIPISPFRIVETVPAQGTGSGTIAITIHPHTGPQNRSVDLRIASIPLSVIQSAAALPVAGPNAILAYSGTAGETLSHGQAGILTTDQFKVSSLAFGGLPVYLILDALQPSAPWPSRFTVTMEAANRTPLSPGVYADLTRWLGPGGATNTASVAINSFTCDVSNNSSFEIVDIARNSDGTLNRVHFKMLYRCSTDPPTRLLTLEGWYPSKGVF